MPNPATNHQLAEFGFPIETSRVPFCGLRQSTPPVDTVSQFNPIPLTFVKWDQEGRLNGGNYIAKGGWYYILAANLRGSRAGWVGTAIGTNLKGYIAYQVQDAGTSSNRANGCSASVVVYLYPGEIVTLYEYHNYNATTFNTGFLHVVPLSFLSSVQPKAECYGQAGIATNYGGSYQTIVAGGWRTIENSVLYGTSYGNYTLDLANYRIYAPRGWHMITFKYQGWGNDTCVEFGVGINGSVTSGSYFWTNDNFQAQNQHIVSVPWYSKGTDYFSLLVYSSSGTRCYYANLSLTAMPWLDLTL